MTEQVGGSDVGRSETAARRDGDIWRLTGTKWFTSAVTADMALTLSRPEGGDTGGRGLAMFYVELRDGAGRLNDLRVLGLKDKLGTRQMPTAELADESLSAFVAEVHRAAAMGRHEELAAVGEQALEIVETVADEPPGDGALARDVALR